MASKIPQDVDIVIVGNGPSALILSYILHGNIPFYAGEHHDPIIDAKLVREPCLLDVKSDVYAHFPSSLRYSTQALPINTLLDTLLRPNADTEANPTSCIEWRHTPECAVPHVVLGNASHAGGQWADNSAFASWEIGTLSYAEMLSLPGYSFAEHYLKVHKEPMPELQRPTRLEATEYYKTYPEAVGIAGAIHHSTEVNDISRTPHGFLIGSHKIKCRLLVLASGIFTMNLPPPPSLAGVNNIRDTSQPLLVIGSGFSAADAILSSPPHRKIVHIFRWFPDERPSPLRGCHHQAYPEYAGIYRQMKFAALCNHARVKLATSLRTRRKSSSILGQTDRKDVYQGLPNATVVDVTPGAKGSVIRIKTSSGDLLETVVGELAFVVGRRGSLGYLSSQLLTEVLGAPSEESIEHSIPSLVSGRSLRLKAEASPEVARDVFIVGSLTGDSLVRHAFGSAVLTAGKLISSALKGHNNYEVKDTVTTLGSPSRLPSAPLSDDTTSPNSPGISASPTIRINGATHEDLHLDRRKLVHAATAKNNKESSHALATKPQAE